MVTGNRDSATGDEPLAKPALAKTPLTRTPLAKMVYLIKRRPEATREELIANWFANHMPDVIEGQRTQAERGRPHAHRYIATVFNPDRQGEQAWDGVAQLWWDEALAQPSEPHGSEPRDTFQQKAEPYLPWATTEYVAIDGKLPVVPNTLNQPFPCTRSGFLKVTALIKAQPDVDYDAFFTHWLGSHAANVSEVMARTGGSRYVISHSDQPTAERYAGMAELYFPDRDALRRYREAIKPDGMDTWVDRSGSPTLLATTEMVGIP